MRGGFTLNNFATTLSGKVPPGTARMLVLALH